MNNLSVDLYVKPYSENEYKRVELFDFEEVNLTSKIKEIRDIRKVFTDFSQEFTIPASKKNNRIFKHYNNWEVDNGFDARVKSDAIIKINGIDYKEGKVTLSGSDMRNDSLYSYRVIFYGKTVNLKDLMGDDKLELLGTSSIYNDLQPYLDRFNFEYNSETVKNGLNKGFVLNNDVIDINSDAGADSAGDLCFPFISSSSFYFYDTGDGANPKDRVDSRNVYDAGAGGNTPRGIFYKDLKPSIRVYHIIKAIEQKYGIEFSNDFFDASNEPFYDLHLLLHREKGDIESQFDIPRASVRLGDFTYTTINDPEYLDIRDSDNENRITTIDVGGADDNADLIQLTYTVNTGSSVTYRVYVKDEITGEKVYGFNGVDSGTDIVSSGNDSFVFRISTPNIESGVKVEPRFYIECDTFSVFSVDVSINRYGAQPNPFRLVLLSRSEYQTIGQVVVRNAFDLATQLPKMKTIDFLTSLFNVFNLTAYYVPSFARSEDAGKIKVRTLDSYYAYGKVNDITKYIDTAKTSVNRDELFSTIDFEFSKPSTFAIINSNNITYDEFGNERLNNTSKDINSPLAFDGGKYKVDNKFEKVQYERMSNQANELITDVQWGWLANKDENATLTKPLIFYPIKQVSSEGLLFDEDKIGEEPSILPNNTYIRPSNALKGATESINYGSEFDEFEVHDSILSNESSLFNLYHRNYVLRAYEQKSRRVNVKANLPLNILTKIELNDTIRIKNQYFHINSLNLNLNTGEAKMELLNRGTSIQACNMELTKPIVRIIDSTDTSLTIKVMGNPLIQEVKYDVYLDESLILENQSSDEINITGLTADTNYEIVVIAKIECSDLADNPDEEGSFLLTEDGFYLLTEDSTLILLETGTVNSQPSEITNGRTTT